MNLLNASFNMPEHLSFFFHSYIFAGDAANRRLLGDLASSGYSRFNPFVSIILQDISDGEVMEISAPDIEAEVNSRARL